MQRTLSEIYAMYRIPPWLALHMQRVAAVAATLFDARAAASGGASQSTADRTDLITACLLHDMGNVIKFDFDRLLLSAPDERSYWETVKKELIAKYGPDEHTATIAILKELGVSPRVQHIVDTINFMRADEIEISSDLLTQITQYADTRVVPSGIASLDARMEDMYIRYADKHPKNDAVVQTKVQALKRMEQSLFRGLSMKPEDITEESMAALRDSFTNIPIC